MLGSPLIRAAGAFEVALEASLESVVHVEGMVQSAASMTSLVQEAMQETRRWQPVMKLLRLQSFPLLFR